VYRGANYDTKTLCAFEKARVLDLIVKILNKFPNFNKIINISKVIKIYNIIII